jgi:hypothetical protein
MSHKSLSEANARTNRVASTEGSKANETSSEMPELTFRLTQEGRDALDQCVAKHIPGVSQRFRRYAFDVCGTEWASYGHGRTRDYVLMFVPMIQALKPIVAKSFEDSLVPGAEHQTRCIWNLICGVYAAPETIPPLWPWRTQELFNNLEFEKAMRTMIRCILLDLSPIPQPDYEAKAAERQQKVLPLLRAKSWTRSRWATEAGVGKNCVYLYLDGTRTLTKENRRAMAEVLGLKPEDLPN